MENLPRVWEQIKVLPLVCLSFLKKGFNTNSVDRIYENNRDCRMVRQNLLLEGFQIRATLVICFCWAWVSAWKVGNLLSHASLVFSLITLSSEWFAFCLNNKSKNNELNLQNTCFFFWWKNAELDICIKPSPFTPLVTNYEYFISKLYIPNVWRHSGWALQEILF